jgi:hypothetical protein
MSRSRSSSTTARSSGGSSGSSSRFGDEGPSAPLLIPIASLGHTLLARSASQRAIATGACLIRQADPASSPPSTCSLLAPENIPPSAGSYHHDQSIHPSPSPSASRKNSDGALCLSRCSEEPCDKEGTGDVALTRFPLGPWPLRLTPLSLLSPPAGSSHMVPGSPGLSSTPFNFMSPMIRKDSSSSSHSDGGGSCTTPHAETIENTGSGSSGGSSGSAAAGPSSSPVSQPPLPPPGFQPPIAFNPAAQIFVRQSGAAGGGSSNSGSGNRASSGENGQNKSRVKRTGGGGGRAADDRRSSDPATSSNGASFQSSCP